MPVNAGQPTDEIGSNRNVVTPKYTENSMDGMSKQRRSLEGNVTRILRIRKCFSWYIISRGRGRPRATYLTKLNGLRNERWEAWQSRCGEKTVQLIVFYCRHCSAHM